MPDINEVIVFTVGPLLIAGATSALIEQLKTNPAQVILIFIITFALLMAYSIYDTRRIRKKYNSSDSEDQENYTEPQGRVVASQKTINNTPPLFENYEDLRLAASKITRPSNLSERDEAKTYSQLINDSEANVDLKIEKLKELGWWNYIKSQIFLENSHEFYGKADVLSNLLKHGIWFSTYRYRFEPTIFLAINKAGNLCHDLVSTIIEKGVSINDHNLHEDNILEAYISHCIKHSYGEYNLSEAEMVLDDIIYLCGKGAVFNFEKAKRVYDLANTFPPKTKNKLLELFSKKNEELLDLNTTNTVATTRKNTRL